MTQTCSLCSTRCAALIALATAAGISRMELDQVAERTCRAATSMEQSSESVARRTACFQLAHAIAPWLNWHEAFARAFTDVDENGREPMAAAPVSAGPPILISGVRVAPPAVFHAACAAISSGALSAREHAFPFAIGPPARAPISHPRADGTPVCCDSAARRTSPARIAAHTLVSPLARLACPLAPSPELAGRLNESSSAVRVGSQLFPKLPARSEVFRRSLDRFCS
jgi:hypothetical protein